MKRLWKQHFRLRARIVWTLLLFSFSLLAWQPQPDYLTDYVQSLRLKLKQFTINSQEHKIYLACDKPIYEPGDVIWFSIFDRKASMQPSGIQHVRVELINPQGSVEAATEMSTGNTGNSGHIKGNFNLKPDQLGGLYKLRVSGYSSSYIRSLPFEREILVQNIVMPRLKLNMDFLRKAYGPDSYVDARVKAFSNANKPLSGTAFRYVVMVGGNTVHTGSGKIDAAGEAIVKFRLPEKLEKPDGVLNLLFNYEGITESVSRSIPIVLNKVEMEFFPEGGDMVNGVQSQVGFRALNEFNKPADVSGEIIDDRGKVVASFSSFHDGMGEFSLQPEEGRSYQARLISPAGIRSTYPLPDAMANGYVLEVSEPQKELLKVNIKASVPGRVALIGQMRNQLQYEKVLDVKPGNNRLDISTKDFPIGVLQLTLLDRKTIERAERLVFVNRHKQLNIKIKTDKEKYQTREKVKVTVSASDEDGMPVPANLVLSVVDDQLLSFADDKSSTVLSWMLVESEIKGKVEDPKFYFDPKEAKAPKALDLLLKTAGWRRFTWNEVAQTQLPYYEYVGEKLLHKSQYKVTYEDAAIHFRRGISGKLLASGSKTPVADVTVLLIQNGRQIDWGMTDQDGRFVFHSKYAGKYDLEFASHEVVPSLITGVENHSDYQHVNLEVNLPMVKQVAMPGQLEAVEIVGYKEPLIVKDAVPSGQYVTSFADEDASAPDIRGARSVGTAYSVNGVKQVGAMPNQPPSVQNKRAVQQLQQVQLQHVNTHNADLKVSERAAAKPVTTPHSYTRVREFASPVYGKEEAVKERNDFRKTLLWQPQVSIGRSGVTSFEFYTGDDITSYSILAEGISAEGNPGRQELKFYTQLPFSMDAKLPQVTLENDLISIPLIMKNNTDREVKGQLRLEHPAGWKFVGKLEPEQVIRPNSTNTFYLSYQVQPKPGEYTFKVAFQANGLQDAFTQPVRVEHRGYPISKSMAGSEGEREFWVDASNMTPGTAHLSFTAYPSVVADMLKGVEGMLREPYGCFEQTSSSSYPNLLVLEYLREQNSPDAAAIQRAEQLLARGYSRLVTFETKERGYEWFGAAPAHEGLTAYALLQFADMKRIGGQVDDAMLERTQQWMLSRRDGKGGYLMNSRSLDSFGSANSAITNAYITYSLAEAGYEGLKTELDVAAENAVASQDPYQLALIANACFATGDKIRGQSFVDKLLTFQKEDGSWTGATHSITHSTGQALKVETTALVLLAMLKADIKPIQALQNGIKFIASSRNGYGSFSSTQSTLLALKALSAYARYSKRTAESGAVQLYVNNRQAGEKSYEADQPGEIQILTAGTLVQQPDNYRLKVKFQKVKTPLPFSLVLDYYSNLPQNSPECKVLLQTSLQSAETNVGHTVRYVATLKNLKQEGLPMTLAVLGIPAGMSVQPWQLKELMEKNVISFYEINGNRLACYFRSMAPGAEAVINLDLKAEFPGTYEAPASSAYLYYTNEHRNWAAGPKVTIKP